MDYLQLVLELVAGLVGFPALLAAIINALKYFGWLPDGSAPKVSMVAHMIAYVGAGVLVYLGKVDILPGLDVQLGAAANVLLAVLAFLSSLGTAGKIHNSLSDARVPVLGYSHPWTVADLADDEE